MKKLLLTLASCGLSLSLLGGCTAHVGSSVKVPPDAKNTCSTHCSELGMTLSAVAIMANNVGCVCRVNSESASSGEAESVTGGMATIMLQEEAARQQQAQQSQHHASY